MLDSPIDDHLPGRLVFLGLPWHGLVRAPLLEHEGTNSCPMSALRLDTHGGVDLQPFPGPALFIWHSAARPHDTRLFADPRGQDALELENGEDRSQYLVVSSAVTFGEAGIIPADGTPYSNGSQVYIWETLFDSVRFYNEVRIGRSEPENWRFETINVPHGAASFHNNICDSTPDGASALYCTPTWSFFYGDRLPLPLRRVDVSGTWPEFTATSYIIMDVDETASSELLSEYGTPPGSREWWLYRVRGLCGTNGYEAGCSYWIVDEPAIMGVPGAFEKSYEWGYIRRDRWLMSAWFDHAAAVRHVWFEHRTEHDEDHDADYGLDAPPVLITPGETLNDVSLLARWTIDRRTEKNTIHKFRLLDGSSVVSECVLERNIVSTAKTHGVLADGAAEGAEPIDDEFTWTLTCSLQLDGKSILPDFGGPWTGDKSPQRDDPVLPSNVKVNYMLYRPGGDQCLAVRVEPYRFSATVICILVTCLHFEWRSGSWAMERYRRYFGHTFHRGTTDHRVIAEDGQHQVYGSGCPKTGKIARNYRYPVFWI